MTVEAARQCVKDRKEWSALVHMLMIELNGPLLVDPVFFRTAHPCSGGLSPREGWDAGGVNCKMGITF